MRDCCAHAAPWHSDDDVEQVYGLLDVLLDECAHDSLLPLLG